MSVRWCKDDDGSDDVGRKDDDAGLRPSHPLLSMVVMMIPPQMSHHPPTRYPLLQPTCRRRSAPQHLTQTSPSRSDGVF